MSKEKELEVELRVLRLRRKLFVYRYGYPVLIGVITGLIVVFLVKIGIKLV